MERKLLSLHVEYGGIGLVIFYGIAENGYNNSRAVTASLVKLQLEQNTIYSVHREEMKMLKTVAKRQFYNPETQPYEKCKH